MTTLKMQHKASISFLTTDQKPYWSKSRLLSIVRSKERNFYCKIPIFGATSIEIRVKRSKVKVTNWSYLSWPEISLKDQITCFVVKQCLGRCKRLYLYHIVLQKRHILTYLSRG